MLELVGTPLSLVHFPDPPSSLFLFPAIYLHKKNWLICPEEFSHGPDFASSIPGCSRACSSVLRNSSKCVVEPGGLIRFRLGIVGKSRFTGRLEYLVMFSGTENRLSGKDPVFHARQ